MFDSGRSLVERKSHSDVVARENTIQACSPLSSFQSTIDEAHLCIRKIAMIVPAVPLN